MPNFRRNLTPGGTFFFTVATAERRPLFGYRRVVGRKRSVAVSGSIVTRKRPRKSIPRIPRNRSSSVRSSTIAARLEAACPPTRSSRTATMGSVATPPLASAIRRLAPGFGASPRAVAVALLRPVNAQPVSTRKSKSCPLTRAGTRSTPPWARRPGIRLPLPKAHPESFGDRVAGEEHVEALERMRGTIRLLVFFKRAAIVSVQDHVPLNRHIDTVGAPHPQGYPFVAILSAGCRHEHGGTIPDACARSQFRSRECWFATRWGRPRGEPGRCCRVTLPQADSAISGPVFTTIGSSAAGIADFVLDLVLVQVDGGYTGAVQAEQERHPVHATRRLQTIGSSTQQMMR